MGHVKYVTSCSKFTDVPYYKRNIVLTWFINKVTVNESINRL